MPTSRWCAKFGIPERTWRRWQARARREQPTRGAWPQPARMPVRELVLQHALAHPAWGHRKIWAMVRHEGRLVSQSTVLRIPREEGLILSPRYQAERRQLAAARKAAFADPPTAPNHVWQLDFTEVETTRGGTWRIAACRDYWSKYELGWHIGQVPASGVALCSFAGGSGSECWQLVGSDLGVGGGDGVDAAAGEEDPDGVGAAADLAVESFGGVVGPDLGPHVFGEFGEGQDVRTRLVEVVVDLRQLLRDVVQEPVELGRAPPAGRAGRRRCAASPSLPATCSSESRS